MIKRSMTYRIEAATMTIASGNDKCKDDDSTEEQKRSRKFNWVPL